jgi:hypothetical protein
MHTKTLTATVAIGLMTGFATADLVQIDIFGEVEFNQIGSGVFAGVNAGDAAHYSFQVDTANFLDSGTFPTRGYEVIGSSTSIDLGTASAGLADPYSGGATPYFILRNDDPAVDGFFLGENVDGFPSGIELDAPGIFGNFRAAFNVTYGNDPLASLDIADAVGNYAFNGLTVFGMTIDDGPFNAMGLIFESMQISLVPAPAAFALFVPLAWAGGRRRRD